MFKDRNDAGKRLAERLVNRRGQDVMILAIPRGGVVIGYWISEVLQAPLDVVIPRKLGAPYNPELAIGAVMHDGTTVLNNDVVSMLNVTEGYIEEEKSRQMAEVGRRLILYRGSSDYPSMKGKTSIIVDDGIATGATMLAALQWSKKVALITVAAIPVGSVDGLERIEKVADDVICIERPHYFGAVGEFYEDFRQVSDEEVIDLLLKASVMRPA